MERWKKSQLFAMNHLGRADLALSKKKNAFVHRQDSVPSTDRQHRGVEDAEELMSLWVEGS